MGFQPKATKEENVAAANDWLGKAIRLEGEGKSEKMVDMALGRACEFEDAAFVVKASE